MHTADNAGPLHDKGCITSYVVADASSETAPPGNDAPLKHLPIDAAGLHDDDWETCQEPNQY